MHFSKRCRIMVGFLLGAVASEAQGDALHSPLQPIAYQTTGEIGTSGITGTNVISFTGQSDGAFYDPSKGQQEAPPPGGPNELGNWHETWSFSFGEFHLLSGYQGTTSYDHTPFSMTLSIAGQSPILLQGTLTGTIVGSTSSTVVADFNPFGLLKSTDGSETRVPFSLNDQFQFTSGDHLNSIALATPHARLIAANEPGGSGVGGAGIDGLIEPQTVPEPTTLALATLLASSLIPGHLRRCQPRRQQSQKS